MSFIILLSIFRIFCCLFLLKLLIFPSIKLTSNISLIVLIIEAIYLLFWISFSSSSLKMFPNVLLNSIDLLMMIWNKASLDKCLFLSTNSTTDALKTPTIACVMVSTIAWAYSGFLSTDDSTEDENNDFFSTSEQLKVRDLVCFFVEFLKQFFWCEEKSELVNFFSHLRQYFSPLVKMKEYSKTDLI